MKRQTLGIKDKAKYKKMEYLLCAIGELKAFFQSCDKSKIKE